jgi:hypothetical protein
LGRAEEKIRQKKLYYTIPHRKHHGAKKINPCFSSSYPTTHKHHFRIRIRIALVYLEAMKTWYNILIYVISNKMDPESKQLWARRISAVEEPSYEMQITFLEELQLKDESVPQRIFTHTQQ